MSKLRVLDLFSGIGGFSLGLERTGGFETVAFCEIEPFPRRVLAKHWPEVPIYEDVRTLTGDVLERDGIAVDVITGGFPCQDLSVSGKQRGLGEGTRSGLWSEIVRLIGDLSPRYVIVENVANLLSGPSEKRGGWFGRVLGDLAECGYDAEWRNIPACMVGARHRRERVWIVGHARQNANRELTGRARPVGRHGLVSPERNEKANEPHGSSEDVANASQLHSNGRENNSGKFVGTWPLSKLRNDGGAVFIPNPQRDGLQGQRRTKGQLRAEAESNWQAGRVVHDCGWHTEPDVGRVANGVPNGMDRLAGLGNAVVPQIPELIGRAILEAERSA